MILYKITTVGNRMNISIGEWNECSSHRETEDKGATINIQNSKICICGVQKFHQNHKQLQPTIIYGV